MEEQETPMENQEAQLEQPAPIEGEIIEEPQTHSRIVERRTVENVMEDSYLRYSMSVIVASCAS